MTIRQAIDEVCLYVANSMDEGWMIKQLSRCESALYITIIQVYKPETEPFEGFREDTPDETVLLVGEPHDVLYVRWLEAQIHYVNGDIDRYNNAITMFNAEVQAFRREYARTAAVSSRGQRFRF